MAFLFWTKLQRLNTEIAARILQGLLMNEKLQILFLLNSITQSSHLVQFIFPSEFFEPA